jgi:hypothetical protein
MKWIFHPCQLRNDYILFCNNVFSLFHDKGNPQLATELLTKFPDCIHNEVNHQAASKQHKCILVKLLRRW